MSYLEFHLTPAKSIVPNFGRGPNDDASLGGNDPNGPVLDSQASVSVKWLEPISVLLDQTIRGDETLVDRVQITRLAESIPRWQIRELKVSMSQLRYALRASEEQIQEAVKLKPGEQMLIDLYFA